MAISLANWWKAVRDGDRDQRLIYEARTKDPGYPSRYGTCLGEPTIHPWSACIGAITRLQKVLDQNVTARSLLEVWQKAGFKYV